MPENKIISFIKTNGPITFEKFMEFALYDKESGYYTTDSGKFGKSGDFYTSPTVHKAFGQVISNFITRVYESIAEKEIYVAEIGAGSGYLALDILESLKENNKELYESLNYICIDSGQQNLKRSEQLLAEHKEKVFRTTNIAELGRKINGIVLSNELFDALPFHRIIFKDNRPREIYVSFDNNVFFEEPGELSNPRLEKIIEDLNLDFSEDQQIEINLNFEGILKQICNILNKGIVLTFDYGYLQKELYRPKRHEGTYRCFHNHEISANPYINIGKQDITSSVDFSALINIGKQNGLDTIKYCTQGQFLIDWGILDIIETVEEKQRAVIKNLFLPGTMGDMFKALVQQKNMKESFMENYPESVLKISYQTTEDRI